MAASGATRRPSTPARSRCTSGGCGEDRARPLQPAPADRVGRRLPVRAVILEAVVVAGATLAVGLAAALALRTLPTVRLQLIGLAALAVIVPLAAVTLSGWVMFHMGDDVKILAVRGCLRLGGSRRSALSSRARSRDSIDRVRRLDRARGRRSGGARARARPAEVAGWRPPSTRWPRASSGCSTPAGARRLGESRPEDAARQHAGDARGARGRPRRAGDVPPGAAGADPVLRCSSTTSSSWRGSTRARSRSSSEATADARRRVVPARARGRGARSSVACGYARGTVRCRCMPPTRWSACCSIS